MNEEHHIDALPHSVGAEKAVLSVLLGFPENYHDRGTLSREWFYLPRHTILYDVIAEAMESGGVELVALNQRLLDTGRSDSTGGAAYLADIYGYAPSPTAFHQHLAILRGKLAARMAIEAATSIIAVANQAPEPQELLDVLGEPITAIYETMAESAPMTDTKELSRRFMERFERLCKGEVTPMGIPTGIKEIDAALKGLQPRQLGIISARPSGGKSTLATQIFSNIGSTGKAVGYFPLEGTTDAAYTRCVIQMSRLVSRAVTDPILHADLASRSGLTKEETDAIRSAIRTLALGKFVFDPPRSPDIGSVIACIRRAHRKHGIEVAFVDYIQLISAKGLRTKEEEVSHISKSLLRVGVELGISMVVMSQENEEGETKHARAIEEDADWWVQVVQHQDRNKDNYKQHRYCLIAKDRHNGKGGWRLPLILDADTVRFIYGMEEKPSKKGKYAGF